MLVGPFGFPKELKNTHTLKIAIYWNELFIIK